MNTETIYVLCWQYEYDSWGIIKAFTEIENAEAEKDILSKLMLDKQLTIIECKLFE